MVLDHRGDDHIIGFEAQPVGEVVDGLGGVAADDRHVIAVVGSPGEAQCGSSGLLVGGGGLPGFIARTPVHTRVPRQELVHRLGHRGQRVRGCGSVEVEVRPLLTVDAGDSQTVADQGDRRPSRGAAGHLRRPARRSPVVTAPGCCARCSATPPPAAPLAARRAPLRGPQQLP